ncbi:MAG: ribonuclease HI family protein [Nitrospiraceae bacterium]|nr:ribonuclease HI family protein [Nitrospiraceae bacterium]
MTKKARIHSDGASSGNPGRSGIGVVVEMGGKTYEISRYIGITTNNVAEYTALIEALKKAAEAGAEEVDVYLDSELAVKQINGQYQVRHENIKPLYARAVSLLRGFRKYSVRHVPRELNKEADALSKEAIKSAPPR